MTLYPKLITDALATVRYPGTGKDIVSAEESFWSFHAIPIRSCSQQ